MDVKEPNYQEATNVKTTRETQVSNQIGQARNVLEDLHMNLEVLTKRLYPVSMPILTEEKEFNSADRESYVPMAEEIFSIVSGITKASQIVNELSNRLEI